MNTEEDGPDFDPNECAQCESTNIYWDPADGWTCTDCGAMDADE